MEQAGERLSRGKEVDAAVRRSHGEEEAQRLLERGQRHFGLTSEGLAG